MTYRIDLEASAAEEVRRIGHNRLRRAVEATDTAISASSDPDRAAETAASVFVMRRRCKQVRALVRLVDPHLDETRSVDRDLRAAARAGAAVRDAEVVLRSLARVNELVGDVSVELPTVSPELDLVEQLARPAPAAATP